jgi:hypothetical protein
LTGNEVKERESSKYFYPELISTGREGLEPGTLVPPQLVKKFVLRKLGTGVAAVYCLLPEGNSRAVRRLTTSHSILESLGLTGSIARSRLFRGLYTMLPKKHKNNQNGSKESCICGVRHRR